MPWAANPTVSYDFQRGSPFVHLAERWLYHHEDMENTAKKSSVLETTVLTISSLGLGAYCASFAQNLTMRVILFAIPTATLFASQRRKKQLVLAIDTPRHTAVEYLSGVHAA